MFSTVEEHMKKYFFISLISVLFLLGWVSQSVADTKSPRGKSAAASLLSDELKSMKIDDYFVESKTSPVGSVQSATGYVVVVHKDTNRAYFAAPGDAVYQQDIFYTLKNSRCRIKFLTEDIITMGQDSKIVAEEIIYDQAAQKKSSVISMVKGKAMFYVVRLFKHKTVSASVRTPTAVMGVRGTKFGVDVRKTGDKVADLSDDSFILLAQNEPGNIETVVYGFEGEVEVTSTGDGSTNTVGAGETLVVDSFGAGDVEPTNLNAGNQFIEDTEGGGGTGLTGGTVGAGWTGGPSWPGGTGGISWTSWTDGSGVGEGGGLIGDTGYDPSENVGQNLTFSANDVPLPPPPPPPPPVEPTPPPVEPTPVPIEPASSPVEPTTTPDVPPATQPWYVNYFTAMLTGIGEGNTFQNLYISDSIQGIGSAVANATGTSGGSMTIDGSGGSSQVKITSITGIGDTDSISGEYIINHTPLTESNTNMSWGFWTRTEPMISNGEAEYLVDNRGYYIYGNNTSNADMSSLASNTAWWQYSGGAEGTYWTDAGGTLMGGNFSSKVNFSTGEIKEFDLYVEGGVEVVHFAQVEGASGSFGETSHFSLSGGTASIGASETGGVFQAYGSFYGSAAQSMGGVWNIEDTYNNKHASGIFHSDTKEELVVNKMGYFAAMLTAWNSASGYYNNGVFVSTSLQDLNGNGCSAYDSPSRIMYVDGLTGDAPVLASVDYGASGITGPYFINRTQTGESDFMKWGSWTQTDGMIDTNGDNNWVNNPGYYITGEPTLNLPSSGTYIYEGWAEGTYWTANGGLPGGGIPMTGDFNATVDFGVTAGNQITSFNLDIEGGVDPNIHNVTIVNATGSFGAGPHFVLSGGLWFIDGAGADSKAGYGSFYGPNAEAMGGVWGVRELSGDRYASGIFYSTDRYLP
jgi:hypothetical protein